MCRTFNASLNPCGLAQDQDYYYTDDKVENDFLEYLTIISTLTNITDDSTAKCGMRLAGFACSYIFPRCNEMSMPMAPCQNYCMCTLQDTCSEQWTMIADTIDSMFGDFSSNFTMLIDQISDLGSDCENLDLYSSLTPYATCDNSLPCVSRKSY